MTDQFTTKGFADYFIDQRRYTNRFLDKINELIDWESIEKVLNKKYRKTASADGRPAYPSLPMFTLLLLQRWYGLSDPGLEEAVNDRISFIRFSGFSISSSLPDHSTICRFRNALPELDLFEKLFQEINGQLEKKGGKAYYGYKAHICVDAQDGFILGGHVTPANVADVTEFTRLLGESHLAKDIPVFADKGYSSAKNRTLLEENGYIDGIMHKAARGKPLTFVERLINRLISSVRYKIEQGIGTLKRGYHFSRMRYIGITKGNMELTLTAMAFNLKKAVLMME